MTRGSLGLVTLLATIAVGTSSTSGHPVESVITLLQGLAKTSESEGKEEEVLYSKFEHWCATSIKTLATTTAEEKAKLETLASQIASYNKTISVLDSEIGALTDELLTLSEEGSAAQKERDAGAELYSEEKAALDDTIAAIQEALEILTTTKSETDTGLLQQTLQKVSALVGYKATPAQLKLLQEVDEPKERPDLKAEGDYDSHIKGYKFKSDSVVELLKELALKFEDELTATNAAETNAINAFTLANHARTNVVTAKEESRSAKNTERTAAAEQLATAEGNQASTQADLDADSASLSDTKSACDLKKTEWEERSKTRAGEIEAIETAISILAKVTGVRTEAPGNPSLPTPVVSFLELKKGNPAALKALHLLREEAKHVHSRALERLAGDVETRTKMGDGPFDQVINSIEKMIFHLMNEQKEEDDHKQWCDLELNKTTTSISDKKDKIEELTLKIDEATATAALLGEEVKSADEMVATIQAHMKEATEVRKIGKEENAKATKDAQDAQTAIANAVAVLKEFYKSSGAVKKESWEFLQSSAPVDLPDTPSTWDSGYTSVSDPTAQPDGIVSVLEKVSADFAEMESQTAAQEQSDQEAYDEDMKTSKIEMARRQEESSQKKTEQKRTLEKKASLTAARKSVASEKEATEQYLKDLQPACVDGSSTYEERKEARDGEIEALKQAQDLLQNAFEAKATGFLAVRRQQRQAVLRTD